MFKRCIIIPAFNEEENIISVVEGVRNHTDADIIVINDGSTDLTGERAKEAGDYAETYIWLWNVPMVPGLPDSELGWKHGVPSGAAPW